MQATPTASPLISAHELADILGEPDVKLFDVRGRWGQPAMRSEYAAGHLPGAVFLDWTKRFLEPGKAIQLAAVCGPADARRAFEELGIDRGDRVVLYDDYHHMLAGRIAWAMGRWGFPSVKILHGGWKHWNSLGFPVTTKVPASGPPGNFSPQDASKSSLIDADELAAGADRLCHLDARSAKAHAGDPASPRTGHIPGAINLPYAAVLDPETGLFLEPEALGEVFDRAAPGWRDGPLVTSCGAGYAGTVLRLALQSLGKGSRLFDGSFSAWKADASRPVERCALPD